MSKTIMLGFILILLGIAVIIIAPLLAVLTSAPKTEEGGVVCVVFLFIPICYGAGTSPEFVETLMIISAIFFIFMILLLLILLKFIKKPEEVLSPSTLHHFLKISDKIHYFTLN